MKAITVPFEANIENDLLTVSARVEDAPHFLCLIELSRPYHFALNGQNVVHISGQGHLLIPAPKGTDAAALLDCILYAVTRHEHHKKIEKQADHKKKHRLTRLLACIAGLAFAAYLAVLLMSAISTFDELQIRLSQLHIPLESSLSPPRETIDTQTSEKDSLESALQQEGDPNTTSFPPENHTIPTTALSPDGWTLPQSVRAQIPTNLQTAAEQKLFTVEYSNGHERTLYVFADPECPNCQRLEPALETAAKSFNIVVFPVAVIGREKSIASITPVLCLPPEQRKAAWSGLFDVGHGVMDMGKVAAEEVVVPAGDCDIAGKALGVNEVAYQTYRIPGTPWVIADDGRHVTQDTLQNPLKLQAFMSKAEVDHAVQ